MPMQRPPENLTLREYLEIIVQWKMPSSGEFTDNKTHEYSYGYCYGSNGERQYIQDAAQRALELIR